MEVSSTTPYSYLGSQALKDAMARQPKQENPLQLNEYKFVLHRTPHLVYFCQSVNLPGISLGETVLPSPFATSIRRPGTSIKMDDLTLDFLVNENMSNWTEIRNWMTILLNERNYGQQALNEREKFSDATLILMNSASKAFIEVSFRDVFPIQLGSIQFDSKVTDILPATSRVTFAYTGYEYRYYS